MSPRVTICVLTYGDFLSLVHRCIEAIREFCPRHEYRLVVGANAVSKETLGYLSSLEQSGDIDRLIVSPVNINKNPMMRRMFAGIQTEFIWWFDDDSYFFDSNAFSTWLRTAENALPSTVMWGSLADCSGIDGFTDLEHVLTWVRNASWYRGLPPPSWRLGGKGEFDFRGCGCGDGRWRFAVGGSFLIRTSAVRALDWPDPRLIKLGDDVFLGEAIRQQGWDIAHINNPGVAINTEDRRGDPGSCSPHGISAGTTQFEETGPAQHNIPTSDTFNYSQIQGWFDWESVCNFAIQKANGDAHFVEVGAWKGRSTVYFAQAIRNSGKEIRLDVVDTWDGTVGDEDHSRRLRQLQRPLYEEFLDNVRRADVADIIRPIRSTSVKAATLYSDNTLDFVFLDADHSYAAVKEDLAVWYPKLKKGGLFAGHDYGTWPGVVKAVDEFIEQHGLRLMQHEDCWMLVV